MNVYWVELEVQIWANDKKELEPSEGIEENSNKRGEIMLFFESMFFPIPFSKTKSLLKVKSSSDFTFLYTSYGWEALHLRNLPKSCEKARKLQAKVPHSLWRKCCLFFPGLCNKNPWKWTKQKWDFSSWTSSHHTSISSMFRFQDKTNPSYPRCCFFSLEVSSTEEDLLA